MHDDVRVIKKRPAKVEALTLVRALFSDKNPRPLVFFDLIVGADENVPQKPDPAMLNLILKSGEFDKAIFVGDSKKDELVARNAGMKYLNVCWGFGSQSPSCDNVFTVAEAALYIEKL